MGYRPVSTRAITIDAPPDEVWPWLVQMGCGRAGFYTHEWVERLLFVTYAEGHSATRIHPEWQELHAGDRVPYFRFNTVAVTMVDRPRCVIAGEWLVLEPFARRVSVLGITSRVEAVRTFVRQTAGNVRVMRTRSIPRSGAKCPDTRSGCRPRRRRRRR
jgi:hypothetical protein